MKKRRYLLAVICLFIAVVCSGGFIQSSAVTVQAAAKTTGFVKKGNYWYFYDKKGKLVKGWYQPSSGRNTILEKLVQPNPVSLRSMGKNTVLTQRDEC